MLRNTTRDTILARELFFAKTLKEKARGLIGNSHPRALALQTRWGIHTFGMQFPIDVLVCDDVLRVKAVRRNMGRFSFFFWNPKYLRVFELPAGVLEKSGTEVGDQLEVVSP